MIETIPQGTAILAIGTFAVLSYITKELLSPIALLGWAVSLMGLGFYALDVLSPIFMVLAFMLHGLTIAATGVFEQI